MSNGDRSGDGDRSDGEGRSDGATEHDPFGDGPFGDGPTDEVGEADEADEAFGAHDADEVDDPFSELGEGVEESAGPVIESNADGTDGPPREDPEPGAPADDPFAELDVDADDETAEGDPFESMGTGKVGEEDVWEALDGEASVGADATEFDADAGGEVGDAGAATPGTEATGDEHVVDKRSYCQRCPHFTAPPETACTHEGTEIVESVDFSRFRVRDCPMVDADDPTVDGE